MKWEKLGLVYGARGETEWQHSHAYIPTPVAFGDYIRVFVSFWDKNQNYSPEKRNFSFYGNDRISTC